MMRFGISAAVAFCIMLLVVVSGAQTARTGEQIMNASCTGSCHDATPIQTSAMNEKEWNETIDRMVENGATVDAKERPTLVTYLVRTYGPMPDGPGKAIVLNTCTICHDLTRVKRTGHTPEEWEDILVAMLNEGAPMSYADFPTVHAYLSKNFGVN